MPADPARAARVRALAEDLRDEPGALLPILHEVNDRLGCITTGDEAVIADVLNLSLADVHGVVGFYTDFRRTPPPGTVVRVCLGEACRAVGAEELARGAQAALGVELDARTPDVPVWLERVFCLGNCALGPSVTVRGTLHGRMDEATLRHLVDGAGG